MRKNINWKSFISGVVVGSALFSTVSFAAPAAVKLMVNGKEVVSEVPPQIIDGTTLIPARGLAEALGANVQWDGNSQTVTVQTAPYRQLHDEETGILSPQTAAYLTMLGVQHYWHTSNGGDVPEGAIQTVRVPGSEYDYRWMGRDLDTKAKYIAYLEEVFTPEQAAGYYTAQISHGSLVEVDGKLAQPNADGGSLLNWTQAAVKLVQNGDNQKTYHFSVPLGEGEVDYEERDITLRRIDGKGWRLDVPVNELR